MSFSESNNLEFSLENYQKMLATALENNYEFLSFDNQNRFEVGNKCLLRHDIDTDLSAALELAKVECQLGISSTYFLMLRSPVYNLFARANHEYVLKILELEHSIGLHFDHTFAQQQVGSPEDMINIEAETIEKMFDIKVAVVSFHQPGIEVLQGRVSTGARINTYSKEQLEGYHYISDSNREWKEMHPLLLFQKQQYSHLHLLIHPMWWVSEYRDSTFDVWDYVLMNNFENTQRQIINTERAYGPRRQMQLVRLVGEESK